MTPSEVLPFDRQVVDLKFGDGQAIRVHILSIDAEALENHVAYEVLAVIKPGARPSTPGKLWASSAEEIATVEPTDGNRYLQPPGRPPFRKPWWKIW